MQIKEKLVSPHDPILAQTAEEIPPSEIKFEETQRIIEEMLDIAHGKQQDRIKSVLIGLAAPQIGISKRIILVDVAADGRGKTGDSRVYINPEVIWKSSEQSEWYEGCFSVEHVGTAHICGIVLRPTSIRVRAFTPDAKPIEEGRAGYVARIFQHEIDHLNGKEFISYVTSPDNLHLVEPEEFPRYRNQEGWRTWTKKCPLQVWHKLKRIGKG